MKSINQLFNKIDFFVKIATMTASEASHILEVPDTANPIEIQNAYKHKAKKFHPDVNPSFEAHKQMVEINIARDVLLNSKKYDNAPPINYNMKRKLENGEAIDVRSIGKEISPGLYRLYDFDESLEVEYCDAEKQVWIGSIGKNIETGEILASIGFIFYNNPKYECIWLR